MNVFWLQQTDADIPSHDDWLSAGEALKLSAMRFPKRRADWRLGRWAAKRAVASYVDEPRDTRDLAQIELRPLPSGAPEVFLAGRRAAVSISLSHRARVAVCAVAPPGAALGCDLELIEPHSDAFVADYFTPEERAMVASAPGARRDLLLALLWSGKESALKALHAGLRVDTRSLVVSGLEEPCDSETWLPLRVRYNISRIFHGWWRRTDTLVFTIVADPAPALPVHVPAALNPLLPVGDRMLFQPVRVSHRADISHGAASHRAGEHP